MPLDHYVSQVHLRKFHSPALGNRMMYAIRKTDLKAFTPDAQAVCRIMDGSTNSFLREDRAIEDFLKTVEPKYNVALDKLVEGQIDNECISTIAGFVAYVIVCSPAGMRIHSESLRVDSKFTQALGIASIRQYVADFGNSKWEVLHNNSYDSPFFTSDFPAAIEKTDDPRILNRIVPLAPNLALRIRPDPTLSKGRSDFSFAKFGYARRDLGHEEIVRLNRLIVRCAEETVFYRDDRPWVRPFVSRNRHYRIEPHISRVAAPNGTFLVSTQRIVASTPAG